MATTPGGTYEVIWSLFLEHLGADLAFVGLTFAMFGLPVLLLSPFAGKLVDRRGSLAFIVFGSIVPVLCGLAYTRLESPEPAVFLILAEATGFAFLNPALYAVVAANSPIGRSSTAQGLFGAAGTLGFIVASLGAGVLAAREIVLPFYVFAAVLTTSLVIGLVIGGPRLRAKPPTGTFPAVPDPATARRSRDGGATASTRGAVRSDRSLLNMSTRGGNWLPRPGRHDRTHAQGRVSPVRIAPSVHGVKHLADDRCRLLSRLDRWHKCRSGRVAFAASHRGCYHPRAGWSSGSSSGS